MCGSGGTGHMKSIDPHGALSGRAEGANSRTGSGMVRDGATALWSFETARWSRATMERGRSKNTVNPRRPRVSSHRAHLPVTLCPRPGVRWRDRVVVDFYLCEGNAGGECLEYHLSRRRAAGCNASQASACNVKSGNWPTANHRRPHCTRDGVQRTRIGRVMTSRYRAGGHHTRRWGRSTLPLG